MNISIKWLLPFSLLLLIGMFDFSHRLSITTDDASARSVKASVANRYPTRLTDEQLQALTTLVERYKLTDDKTNNSEQAEQAANKNKLKGLPQAEQAKQSGKLDFLYIGSMRYQLLGIFTKKRDVAVLKQHNIETDEINMVNLQQGQQLGEYRVEHIQPTSIHFISTNQRQISLMLFDIHPSGQPQ